MVAQGHRAVMLFLIQIGSADRFALARDIDPRYGAAFDTARAAGVEAYAYAGHFSGRSRRGGAGADRRLRPAQHHVLARSRRDRIALGREEREQVDSTIPRANPRSR